jgi:hypothetical protein
VGLFTEGGHRDWSLRRKPDLTETSPLGTFQGQYRLVAEYEAFGPANARVPIGRRGATHVAVKMLPLGIDTTGYIDRT